MTTHNPIDWHREVVYATGDDLREDPGPLPSQASDARRQQQQQQLRTRRTRARRVMHLNHGRRG
ncbi:hypothetical protein [Spectribacter hydrogenoxidans]|uniref:Uncharacterized protein n=1 Tax=Spectribacter hydrogenoxidans TaxID=3075608 RepID=A0ABU3C3W7_9GAMM|nr:hypothetical protein [Salinisphaera sp. W335]MDT0636251.1 hypothetical protein [Salinisphaera sp. W335]